jgi:hypothetical protein
VPRGGPVAAPRVGDQHIELTVLGLHPLEQRVDLRVVGVVAGDRDVLPRAAETSSAACGNPATTVCPRVLRPVTYTVAPFTAEPSGDARARTSAANERPPAARRRRVRHDLCRCQMRFVPRIVHGPAGRCDDGVSAALELASARSGMPRRAGRAAGIFDRPAGAWCRTGVDRRLPGRCWCCAGRYGLETRRRDLNGSNTEPSFFILPKLPAARRRRPQLWMPSGRDDNAVPAQSRRRSVARPAAGRRESGPRRSDAAAYRAGPAPPCGNRTPLFRGPVGRHALR